MKEHSKIDLLEQIQRVEVSPFLFTRIEQRIQQSAKDRISPRFAAPVFISLLLLIILNVFVIRTNRKFNKQEVNIARSYGIVTTNSFYND